MINLEMRKEIYDNNKNIKRLIINNTKEKKLNSTNLIDSVSYGLFQLGFINLNSDDRKNILMIYIQELIEDIEDIIEKEICLKLLYNYIENIIDNLLKYANDQYYIKNDINDCACFSYKFFKF